MAMTPEQIKLSGLYLGDQAKIYNPYFKRFLKANAPFLSATNSIKLEELDQTLLIGSILGRDEKIPAKNIDGKMSMTITPAIVGEKIAESADDAILATAAVPIEGNTVVNTLQQVDVRNISRIKAAIENLTERIAAELFLTGSTAMTSLSGRPFTYDLGLNAAVALDLSGSKNLSTSIAVIHQEYFAKWGRSPIIEVGSDIFAALANEINGASGKNTKLNYMGKVTVDGDEMYIEGLGFTIRMLEPATKASDGTVINNKTSMHVYHPSVLVACFAGIDALDMSGNRFKAVGKVFLDRNVADRETARGSVFGKSAPFPAITYVDMFDRYTVTLPA